VSGGTMAAATRGWMLGVLGGFTLTYNNRAVSFTHGTARILAYLAMQERPQRRRTSLGRGGANLVKDMP
jgi:hypothetical protein